MADMKQDLLGLQFSQSFPIQGMQEANIDLELPPASAASATVFGVVTDGTDPIPDATVKLFDSTGTPYRHTLTDETGAFTISEIPTGTYSLGAVKTTLNLGTIAGVLTATDLNGLTTPLAGAQITLA